MDILEDIKKNDLVEIVANNDWNGLIGIVNDRTKEVLSIFCVQKPTYLYYVNQSNKDDIIKFNK